MNKAIAFISVLFFAAGSAKAQGGGWGHFSVGSAYMNFSPLATTLQSSASLGQDFRIRNIGTAIGGGGGGLVGKHWILAGRGAAYSFATKNTGGNEVETGSGFGMFNPGYVVYAKEGWLVYPFGGIGGGGSSMTIKNTSSKPFTVGSRLIQPGEELKVGTGGVAMEAALSINRFFPADNAGVKLGLEFGYIGLPFSSDWDSDQKDISNLGQPAKGLWYLTYTVGGGGFSR